MLTTTLRYLERDGIVKRHLYPEVAPRVEYTLTERGLGLLVPVKAPSRGLKANGLISRSLGRRMMKTNLPANHNLHYAAVDFFTSFTAFAARRMTSMTKSGCESIGTWLLSTAWTDAPMRFATKR
jgi:hypothetical protein